MAKVVIIPSGDIRSTTQTEKGKVFATIHTGKYEVVAEIGTDDRIHVTREVFDQHFVIEDPLPAEV